MKNSSGSFFTIFTSAIIAAVLIAFIYAAVLMWLWNAVVVVLFGAPIIGYWQAYALCIISDILFKSSNSSVSTGRD